MSLKLDPDFKARWVAALRSGEYTQGHSRLYDSTDHTLCCLGVGCLVSGIPRERLEGIPMPTPDMVTSWFSDSCVPYHEVNPYDNCIEASFFSVSLGPNELGSTLPELNDDLGYSFEQIADIIEEQY